MYLSSQEMKENVSLLKILSVAPPPMTPLMALIAQITKKGKKLEIAQITAFSCQSAGHLLTGKNTANNCVGACSFRGR